MSTECSANSYQLRSSSLAVNRSRARERCHVVTLVYTVCPEWGVVRAYWPSQGVWVLVYWPTLRKTLLPWFTVNPAVDWRFRRCPSSVTDYTLEATHQRVRCGCALDATPGTEPPLQGSGPPKDAWFALALSLSRATRGRHRRKPEPPHCPEGNSDLLPQHFNYCVCTAIIRSRIPGEGQMCISCVTWSNRFTASARSRLITSAINC